MVQAGRQSPATNLCPSNHHLNRYDVRATLSDLTPYEVPPGGYSNRLDYLTPAEQKAEQLCEEERYYSLYTNEIEEEAYQGTQYTLSNMIVCPVTHLPYILQRKPLSANNRVTGRSSSTTMDDQRQRNNRHYLNMDQRKQRSRTTRSSHIPISRYPGTLNR